MCFPVNFRHARACFDCKDWDVFFDTADSIDSATGVISDYINFCVDSIVPSKCIKSFPNNKPWISKDIREQIHNKNNLKTSNDRSALKECQRELDNAIRVSKNSYKSKLEGYFKVHRTRDAWFGLNKITGYKSKPNSFSSDSNTTLNDLNNFYARFNSEEHSQSAQDLKDTLCDLSSDYTIAQQQDVCRIFKSLNINKACGPDYIKPRILKCCAEELSPGTSGSVIVGTIASFY